MSNTVDVYRDWLGIGESQRPLNYYQLLKCKLFEDDLSRIRASYRKLNAHVKTFASGSYLAQSQDLLNELAKAMLCLTDAKRKGEYDLTLGRKDKVVAKSKSIEDLLLAQGAIDQSQLHKARSFASAVGLEVREALVQQKLVNPDVVWQAYSESIGLPFIDLQDLTLDSNLLNRVPTILVKRNSVVPVMVADGVLLVASPSPVAPEVEEDIRMRVGIPVRSVLCTPQSVNQAIGLYYKTGSAADAQMAQQQQQQAAGPAQARAPMSADERIAAESKARKMAIVAANFAVLGVMLWLTVLPRKPWSFGPALGVAILAAATLAGITYFAMRPRR